MRRNGFNCVPGKSQNSCQRQPTRKYSPQKFFHEKKGSFFSLVETGESKLNRTISIIVLSIIIRVLSPPTLKTTLCTTPCNCLAKSRGGKVGVQSRGWWRWRGEGPVGWKKAFARLKFCVNHRGGEPRGQSVSRSMQKLETWLIERVPRQLPCVHRGLSRTSATQHPNNTYGSRTLNTLLAYLYAPPVFIRRYDSIKLKAASENMRAFLTVPPKIRLQLNLWKK